jgi:hypothetical protein
MKINEKYEIGAYMVVKKPFQYWIVFLSTIIAAFAQRYALHQPKIILIKSLSANFIQTEIKNQKGAIWQLRCLSKDTSKRAKPMKL